MWSKKFFTLKAQIALLNVLFFICRVLSQANREPQNSENLFMMSLLDRLVVLLTGWWTDGRACSGHRHHCSNSHPYYSNTSYVSHLPGPLLLVVLDVHNASTNKQHEQNVGIWGIQKKDFQWASRCSSLSVCGVGRSEKSRICKMISIISELAGRLLLPGL